jgi:probable H4MPT-linked C1 transfer pathway protein
MADAIVIGWDVGGAHLKAARLEADGTLSRVVQIPCPLWEGTDRLESALDQAGQRIGPAPAHAVTMTGEMADLFADRAEGVERIASIASIASANWHATASLVAGRLPAALLVDIGSTTTDIAAVAGGEPRTRGAGDAQRLAEEELVYTGVVRTPVMALASRAPFAGAWSGLMAEHFATAADLHRLTGELPAEADQHPAADGGPKTQEASARRLARMIGRDLEDAGMDDWRRLARWLADAQLGRIEAACARVLSRGLLAPAAPVVGAGVGRFLAARLARRLERPYVDFSSLVPAGPAAADWAATCAPAAAVAWLLRRRLAEGGNHVGR